MLVPSVTNPLHLNKMSDRSWLPASKCLSIWLRLELTQSSTQPQSYLMTSNRTAPISTSWIRLGRKAVSLMTILSTRIKYLSRKIKLIRQTLSFTNRSILSSRTYKSLKKIAGATLVRMMPSTTIPPWVNNTNTKKGKYRIQCLFRLNQSRSKLSLGAKSASFDLFDFNISTTLTFH